MAAICKVSDSIKDGAALGVVEDDDVFVVIVEDGDGLGVIVKDGAALGFSGPLRQLK